jgi:hypothetical protein
MEVSEQVQTFEIDFQCPICNKGFLRPTGTVLTTYPAQYPHKCNNLLCDYMETFYKTYPFTMYKPKPSKYE